MLGAQSAGRFSRRATIAPALLRALTGSPAPSSLVLLPAHSSFDSVTEVATHSLHSTRVKPVVRQHSHEPLCANCLTVHSDPDYALTHTEPATATGLGVQLFRRGALAISP